MSKALALPLSAAEGETRVWLLCMRSVADEVGMGCAVALSTDKLGLDNLAPVSVGPMMVLNNMQADLGL